MTQPEVAKPHINVPAAKKTLAKAIPARRPYISVSFPDNGWNAAFAMRYPDAIQENNVPELKDAVIGPESVATMVASIPS